jgi:hypothetical protein
MASPADGKIDGSALRQIMRAGEYEDLKLKSVEQREGDAVWIRYEVAGA